MPLALASFANDLAERLDSTTKAMHQALGTVLQQELDRKRLDNQLLLTQNLAEERLKSIINLEGKLADVNHREPLGLDKAQIIREKAAVIVEECSHLSYLRSPDEEESVVERRFRAIKAAAKTIAELKI